MTLYDSLEQISEQSDADMTNLWYGIKQQLEEEELMRKSKSRRLRLGGTWVAAIIAIIVMSGVAFGLSFNQQQIYRHINLAEIEAMATPLNMSINENDLTVQLDWAYMDTNQMFLAYTFYDAEGNAFIPEDRFRALSYMWQLLPNLSDNGDLEYRRFQSLRFSPFSPASNPQQIVFTRFHPQHFEQFGEHLDDGLSLDNLSSFHFDAIFFGRENRNTPYVFEFELPFSSPIFVEDNSLFRHFPQPTFTQMPTEIEFEVDYLFMTESSFNLRACLRIPDDNIYGMYYTSPINLYADDRLIEVQGISRWFMYDINHRYIGVERTSIINHRYDSAIDGTAYCTEIFWDIAFDIMPQTLRVEIPYIRDEGRILDDEVAAQYYIALFEEEGFTLGYANPLNPNEIGYPASWWMLSNAERNAIESRILEQFYQQFPPDERFNEGWQYEFELSASQP